jgi:hypothetical protein
MQVSLFDWTPPQILGPRDGETFDRDRDLSRLNAQCADVYRYMQHGQWRTLADISANTGHPEASVSARLRDMKKEKFGGFKVEKRYIASGLWQYRIAG